MFALLAISVAGFFALYVAMLLMLRRAAAQGALRADSRSRQANQATSRSLPPEERHIPDQHLTRRHKRPDWRFLVREGRRPFPRRDTSSTRKPAAPAPDGRNRADWAHYNKDMGDLNDPYQASPSTARRA